MAEQYRVRLVGITGASGSGKSSFARRLATRLDSPVLPVQMDWFFKAAVPPGTSFEELAAIDMDAFVGAIDALIGAMRRGPAGCNNFATTAAVADTATSDSSQTTTETCAACALDYPPKPKRKGIDVHRHGSAAYSAPPGVGSGDESSAVWLVVEGFLLFADEALAQRFDVRVVMDTPLETCRLRRFLRENEVDRVGIAARNNDAADSSDDARSAQYALSNDFGVVKTAERDPVKMAMLPEYTGKFSAWFDAEVKPWFHHYWETQCRNAAHGAHPRSSPPAAASQESSSGTRLPLVCTLDNAADDPTRVPKLAADLANALRGPTT